MRKINDKSVIDDLAKNLYSCEKIMGETYINVSKQLSKSNGLARKIKKMHKELEKFRGELDNEIHEYISEELLRSTYKNDLILYRIND